MFFQSVIQNLERNKEVFKNLLSGYTKEEYLWKQEAVKWCLLEIICHLHDEEREDFRTRIRFILEGAEGTWPSIDPQNWPTDRGYLKQDYEKTISNFLIERDNSIKWLSSLKDPQWEKAYVHPKFGAMSAHMLLSNWLAHDYLHIRQITKLKYDHLKSLSGETLEYAGNW